jgi:hypothetical protein
MHKRITLPLLLSLLIAVVSHSQQQLPKKIQKEINGPKLKKDQVPTIDSAILNAGVAFTDITLFPQPDYAGKSGNFKWVNGKLVAPFPLNNCSFRVARDRIVYVKTAFEFATETQYSRDQRQANLSGAIGVRSDEEIGLFISLDGISTAIHNNDCRKVYGTVKIMLLESAPDTDSTQSNAMRSAVPGSQRPLAMAGADKWTFTPWKYASAAAVPSNRNYAAYILNNSPAPATANHPEWRDVANDDPKLGYFVCGKEALQQGRLQLHFTSDVASAHKTCDLCDDFSSKIKMRAPAYQSVRLSSYYGAGPLDITLKKFVLGPYDASGSRDGSAITATAGTNKQFKVYYSMRTYE